MSYLESQQADYQRYLDRLGITLRKAQKEVTRALLSCPRRLILHGAEAVASLSASASWKRSGHITMVGRLSYRPKQAQTWSVMSGRTLHWTGCSDRTVRIR